MIKTPKRIITPIKLAPHKVSKDELFDKSNKRKYTKELYKLGALDESDNGKEKIFILDKIKDLKII